MRGFLSSNYDTNLYCFNMVLPIGGTSELYLFLACQVPVTQPFAISALFILSKTTRTFN